MTVDKVDSRANDNLQTMARPFIHSKRWLLVFVCITIVAISVYVRIVTATPIEDGGDAIVKWQFVQLMVNGSLPGGRAILSHHFLRWGVNLPTAAVQLISGYTVQTYYIPTILYATIASLLVLLLGARADRPAAGLAAALLYIFNGELDRSGSQLLPDTFGVCYILAALLFISLYYTEKKYFLIIIAAFLVFCAYGSNITYISQVVPIILFLYFYRNRDLRAIMVMLISLLFLFCIETAIVTYVTGEFRPLGVLQVLSERPLHKRLSLNGEHYDWSDIFLRWQQLPAFWRYQVGAGLAAAVYYIVLFVARKGSDPTAFLLSLSLVWFCVFVTFAIIDTEPLRFLLNPRERYLQLSIPLSGLTASFLVWDMVQRGMAFASASVGKIFGAGSHSAARLTPALSWTVFLAVAVAALLWSMHGRLFGGDITQSNIFRMEQFRKDIQSYYAAGFALAFFRVPTARAVEQIFLGDPPLPTKYGPHKIFQYDGHQVILFAPSIGSKMSDVGEPSSNENLLKLFQGDPCISEQLKSPLAANGIYFFFDQVAFPKGIAFFGNPLIWLVPYRGSTCFSGFPGPPPLDPAPRPGTVPEPE